MPPPALSLALGAPASPERPSGGEASQDRALQDAPAPYSRSIGAKVDLAECYRELTATDRVVADIEERIYAECPQYWVYLECECTAMRVLRGCGKADCPRPGCRKAVAAKRAKRAHARIVASALEAAPGWRPEAVVINRMVFTTPEWAWDRLAEKRQVDRVGRALSDLLKEQLGAVGLMEVVHPVGGDGKQIRGLPFQPHFEVYFWRARGGRGMVSQEELRELGERWREILGCKGDEGESLPPWVEFYRAGGPCEKGKGKQRCHCPGCMRGTLAYSLRTFPGWSSWRGRQWERWYGKRARVDDSGPEPCPCCGKKFKRVTDSRADSLVWERSMAIVKRQAELEHGPPAHGEIVDLSGETTREWFDLAVFDRGYAREFKLEEEAEP